MAEVSISIEFGGDFDQDFANDLNQLQLLYFNSWNNLGNTNSAGFAEEIQHQLLHTEQFGPLTPTSSAGFVGGDSTPASTYGTI